jgi:DNA modification methylase
VSQKKKVRIAEAKGRPMLSWVGKRALTHVPAFPAQHIESFDAAGAGREQEDGDWSDWPDRYPRGGLLFHGDNKEVLAHLLASGFRGRVKLIYIDPPFDSGADYVRRVQLRGAKGSAKIEGESYTLGEQIQYTDIWANDNYLQFMYERLLLLRELLTEDGSIWVHCDWRRSHHFRCLLDEVFGPERLVNEVIWRHQIMGGSHRKRFSKAHENLLWYAKSDAYSLRSESEHVRVPFSDYVRDTMKQDEDGRWFYERRRMSRKATAEEARSRAHTRTYVDDPEAGTVASSVWSDLKSYQESTQERQGLDLYPTQKTSALLRRVISASTDPGDIVLDCFVGSGTAAVVAQALGRRWIGCDINKGAVQTSSKRLQAVMREQSESLAASPQGELAVEDGKEAEPGPAQLSFGVWRVNDYDLQIQHNEAVELACEHIGVERTRADGFFDGVLGKSLVKIVPFTHPLSPVDLDEVRRELEARPEEDRNIVMVCLGKETAADAWINDWNALRKGKTSVNRIEVIELRTDPKYGKFIKHRPAEATVRVERLDGKVRVAVEDFVSPTIIERLEMDAPLFRAKIPDWRAMVDCVMVDPDFDGDVFRVALSDVPARKQDLVSGSYEIEAPTSGAGVVAVKVIDMLGEEVLVVDRP